MSWVIRDIEMRYLADDGQWLTVVHARRFDRLDDAFGEARRLHVEVGVNCLPVLAPAPIRRDRRPFAAA